MSTNSLAAQAFARNRTPFLEHLFRWTEALPTISLTANLRAKGRSPAEIAICCVDLVEGFCRVGPLASDRVTAIIPAVVDLFHRARAADVAHFLVVKEAHRHDAREFGAFPAHCVEGSSEAELVAELAALPFANRFTVFPKNSISAHLATTFDAWLDDHAEVRQFICVGDVTDMCLYQLAMNLHLRANAYHLDWQVIVPADCVQTYDLPVDDAARVGATAHDGDLFHCIFLYHMALSGITVVGHIDP